MFIATTAPTNNAANSLAMWKWCALNGEVDLSLRQQPEFLQVPPPSAYCKAGAFAAGPGAVSNLVTQLSNRMERPSHLSLVRHLYTLAQFHMPFICHTSFQYWAHHKVLSVPYDAAGCNLQGGDSLFLFCPANRHHRDYNDAMATADSITNQAFLGNRRVKLDGSRLWRVAARSMT